MNLHPFIALLLFTAAVATGCSKKGDANPCEGLLNESPPTTILIKFVDKNTGDNLILSGAIKESQVSVIDKEDEEEVKNWQIKRLNSSDSPMNGTLGLTVFHETEAVYTYEIRLGNAGSATLSYTISKTETGDPCKRFAYPMGDLKITDHPFRLMEHEGKALPNFLVLEL